MKLRSAAEVFKKAVPAEVDDEREPGSDFITATWVDPQGQKQTWQGILRVPRPSEMMLAGQRWTETFGNAAFSAIPPEVRAHQWPVYKLAPQLLTQPGGADFLAALEVDAALLQIVDREVSALYAEMFPLMDRNRTSADVPRVALTARRNAAPAEAGADD